MPDIAGMTLTDFGKWFQNLLANPKPVPAESFFQSRITHTPGVMESSADMPKGALAFYDSGESPLAMLQASHLTPEQKATIAESWAPQGKGFIHATPESTAGVLRHESLHDVQNKSPAIQQHLLDIAARVNPQIVSSIERVPAYQREIKNLGYIPTMAREGSAIDLIPGLRNWLPDPPSPQLRDYYMKILASEPARRRQVQQLTDVSTLPDAKSKP